MNTAMKKQWVSMMLIVITCVVLSGCSARGMKEEIQTENGSADTSIRKVAIEANKTRIQSIIDFAGTDYTKEELNVTIYHWDNYVFYGTYDGEMTAVVDENGKVIELDWTINDDSDVIREDFMKAAKEDCPGFTEEENVRMNGTTYEKVTVFDINDKGVAVFLEKDKPVYLVSKGISYEDCIGFIESDKG